MVQMILRFLPAMLLLARILIGIDILYRRRAVAMRSLALKYGFDFTAGPSWYDLRKQTPAAESFRFRGHPVDTLRKNLELDRAAGTAYMSSYSTALTFNGGQRAEKGGIIFPTAN
jgi:hypothetical protein